MHPSRRTDDFGALSGSKQPWQSPRAVCRLSVPPRTPNSRRALHDGFGPAEPVDGLRPLIWGQLDHLAAVIWAFQRDGRSPERVPSNGERRHGSLPDRDALIAATFCNFIKISIMCPHGVVKADITATWNFMQRRPCMLPWSNISRQIRTILASTAVEGSRKHKISTRQALLREVDGHTPPPLSHPPSFFPFYLPPPTVGPIPTSAAPPSPHLRPRTPIRWLPPARWKASLLMTRPRRSCFADPAGGEMLERTPIAGLKMYWSARHRWRPTRGWWRFGDPLGRLPMGRVLRRPWHAQFYFTDAQCLRRQCSRGGFQSTFLTGLPGARTFRWCWPARSAGPGPVGNLFCAPSCGGAQFWRCRQTSSGGGSSSRGVHRWCYVQPQGGHKRCHLHSATFADWHCPPRHRALICREPPSSAIGDAGWAHDGCRLATGLSFRRGGNSDAPVLQARSTHAGHRLPVEHGPHAHGSDVGGRFRFLSELRSSCLQFSCTGRFYRRYGTRWAPPCSWPGVLERGPSTSHRLRTWRSMVDVWGPESLIVALGGWSRRW